MVPLQKPGANSLISPVRIISIVAGTGTLFEGEIHRSRILRILQTPTPLA
jgi:hypothetical protein